MKTKHWAAAFAGTGLVIFGVNAAILWGIKTTLLAIGVWFILVGLILYLDGMD